LANWLWIGSIMFVIGTLVAAWPEGKALSVKRRAWSMEGARA